MYIIDVSHSVIRFIFYCISIYSLIFCQLLFCSKKHFESLLLDMGIQFSKRSFDQMFRRLDRDMDHQVSFDDLFIFMFPEHRIAVIEENARIKTLQSRIRRHGAIYAAAANRKNHRGFKLQVFSNTGRHSHLNFR